MLAFEASSNMAEKQVLVRIGERSRPLTFSSTASEESDENVLKREIRTFRDVLADNDDIFLQVKDEEWAGELAMLLPQLKLQTRAF